MMVDVIPPFSNHVDWKGRICTLVLKDVLRKPAPNLIPILVLAPAHFHQQILPFYLTLEDINSYACSTDIALFLGLEGPIYPSVPTSQLSLTRVSGRGTFVYAENQ